MPASCLHRAMLDGGSEGGRHLARWRTLQVRLHVAPSSWDRAGWVGRPPLLNTSTAVSALLKRTGITSSDDSSRPTRHPLLPPPFASHSLQPTPGQPTTQFSTRTSPPHPTHQYVSSRVHVLTAACTRYTRGQHTALSMHRLFILIVHPDCSSLPQAPYREAASSERL